MRRLLESSRYLILIAVVVVILAAVAGFAAFAWSAVPVIVHLFTIADPSLGAIELLALLDRFLVAVALLIAAIGLYELGIDDLNVPALLTVKTLHQLKGRLAGVIILVMAVKFVEKLAEWKDPVGTLWFALAIAVVSAVLIAYTAFDTDHNGGHTG